MGEKNSPSVAHVGYGISPLSCVEKYRNPRATGESIFISPIISGDTTHIRRYIYIKVYGYVQLFPKIKT